MNAKMKSIVLSITFAVFFGIVLILAPIMVFTYYGPIDSKTGIEKLVSEKESGRAPSNSQEGMSRGLTGFDESAKVYGTMDADTTSYLTSLPYAALIVATGLIVAIGTFLFINTRIRTIQVRH